MISTKITKFNRSVNDLLLRVYQLKYFPVGIKFIKKGGKTFNLPRPKQRKTVCAFLKKAARGEAFFLDKDVISCPGGLKWMGFHSGLTETYFYKYFLGEVEKVKSSPEIAERFLDFLPQPPKEGLYSRLLFSPLKFCRFLPDVVVIITNPRYAYQIIVAAYLDEYHLVRTIPICAACHGSISIPFTTGELNISMIDPMSRKIGNYRDDELLIGIPRPRFNALINNMKKLPSKRGKETIIAKIIKKIID